MLTTRVIGVEDISDDMASDMFGLYARYYACADRGRFASDLNGKDRVIHLLDGNQLAGFTTLDSAPFDVSGQKGLVVFSGDTIVDRPHWGQTQLSYAWLREVAALSQRYEGLPVYWLLIVKGHRTFRFMPAFGKRFVPHWEAREGDQALLKLRDALASERFGAAFDPRTGVLSYGGALDRLASPWVEPSAREAARPDVAFFVRANPGYRQGDELVCLCPLSRDNMRPLTRRVFDAARAP